MAPMPRLVQVAVRIVLRIGEPEAEIAGAAAEPAERGSLLEFDLELRRVVGRDVDRAAGVVLAVARRCADFEDRIEREPLLELAANDLGLALDAAKRRGDADRDAIGFCGCTHCVPRRGRRGSEQMLPPVSPDFRDHYVIGLCLK